LSVTGTGAFTGVVTAPTAANATSNTQVATTAFVGSAVYNATASLGTMSTQNANAVSVTGGTMNGVSGTNSALNVGYATTAGSAGSVPAAGVPGLGYGGSSWHDVAGSRGFGATYTNSYSYPIAVSATATCAVTSEIHAYVDGVLIAWYQWQFNGCGSYGGTFVIVPPGSTYRLDSGQSVYQWKELY
jgi:hypothetical protein